SQGRYSEAEPLYLQALEIRRSQLGNDHPYTASSLNNLATLYYSLDRYAESAAYMEQALEIMERQLGADHPSTKTVRQNLETIRQAMA
ncbi:MAG: tetratricopeptide repeat protein, partial [Oculatellaceae cyanobacterium Prado106]|nr:tetratricopeptide repeat protein [Oculatellaceae cyanobacterium Prado106]